VDQSLEQDSKFAAIYFNFSFNPYFSGSVTGTPRTSGCLGENIVSILILVDQSLEPGEKPVIYSMGIGFNPYFSGSVTGTIRGDKTCSKCERFQSLF